MITDYRALRGPAFDDDCQCHCSGRAADLQDALDEIHILADEAPHDLRDRIHEWTARR